MHLTPTAITYLKRAVHKRRSEKGETGDVDPTLFTANGVPTTSSVFDAPLVIN